MLHQVLGHGCLVFVLDQEVVKSFPEVVRAEEVFNHSDDGRALAVGNDVENGVDLGTGIGSGYLRNFSAESQAIKYVL